MGDHLRLSGAWNFRELITVRTRDGRRLRHGRLFRSSHLANLTESGAGTLSRMGVTDVCDLRRDSEVERIGRDRVPSRVTVHRLPFDYEHDAPHEAKLASTRFATDHMLSVYSEFPVLAPANQAIVQIATLLANGSSLLVHCGAGKDRAGWAIATILTWVGVCEEDIVEDYLTSNTAIDELKSSIESGDGETTDSMLPLLRVQDIYLRRSFDRVDAVYGSFEAYADHIGLTRETLSRLEDELLDS